MACLRAIFTAVRLARAPRRARGCCRLGLGTRRRGAPRAFDGCPLHPSWTRPRTRGPPSRRRLPCSVAHRLEINSSTTPRNDLHPLPGRWHDSLRAPATDDVEVLMTRTRVPPVLVTGATGRVGRVVVDLLIDAGVPVRTLTHRSEVAATLPANVDNVTGDLTVPES